MFVIKKKQLIICCVAVLVAVGGYLNMLYGSKEAEVANVETIGEIHLVEEEKAGDFFEAARMERDLYRSETRETLSSIMENENSESASKAKAEEELIKMAKIKESEAASESLIKSKGYKDAVVFIGDNSVNAVVKAEKLTEQDATKICEIITSQTGFKPSAIKITQSE